MRTACAFLLACSCFWLSSCSVEWDGHHVAAVPLGTWNVATTGPAVSNVVVVTREAAAK